MKPETIMIDEKTVEEEVTADTQQDTQPDLMPTDLPDNEPVTLFSGPLTMISGDSKYIPGYHLLATDRHASEVLRMFATFLSLQGEKGRANEARSRALDMEDWYKTFALFLSMEENQ